MTQSLQNRAAPCEQAQDTQKPSQTVPMAVPSQGGEPKVSSIYNVRDRRAPHFTAKHAVSKGRDVTLSGTTSKHLFYTAIFLFT